MFDRDDNCNLFYLDFCVFKRRPGFKYGCLVRHDRVQHRRTHDNREEFK